MIDRPHQDEYAGFFAGYVNRVPAGDVLALLETQLTQFRELLQPITDSQARIRPTPVDWNLKEVVGHLNDTERIFGYRALRFSRRDNNPLPGFDQDPYVEFSNFSERTLQDLFAEFEALRTANLILYRSFTPEMLLLKGVASENVVSVRAMIYVTAGHFDHHWESIHQQYLPAMA